jgi:subtilisin family serine protease
VDEIANVDEANSVFTTVADADWVNPADPVTNPTGVATANSICAAFGVTPSYIGDEIGSFVVPMTEAQARAMSHDSRVIGVSSDFESATDTVQPTPWTPYDMWGLDRLDQRDLYPRSETYTYFAKGTGVHVYIADTGIWVGDPEFGGRASLDYSAVNGESPDGASAPGHHGHNVASLVGGNIAGVAKGVRLHSVKTLNKHNKTYTSTIVRASNWIIKHHQKPAIVNMSFGGRKVAGFWGFGGTGAQDRAILRLLGKGIIVVMSAGNSNNNTNDYVPATVSEGITVGASDRTYGTNAVDIRASFSNHGSEVDVFAPGVNLYTREFVVSGSQRYPVPNTSFGGTSGAAPYVTGVIAKHLQLYPTLKPSQVQTWLKNNASVGKIMQSTLPGSTPNRMVYTNE